MNLRSRNCNTRNRLFKAPHYTTTLAPVTAAPASSSPSLSPSTKPVTSVPTLWRVRHHPAQPRLQVPNLLQHPPVPSLQVPAPLQTLWRVHHRPTQPRLQLCHLLQHRPILNLQVPVLQTPLLALHLFQQPLPFFKWPFRAPNLVSKWNYQVDTSMTLIPSAMNSAEYILS